MCGRFTLAASPEEIAAEFGIARMPPLAPRYNVAPTQAVAAVRLDPDGTRRLDFLKWGLVPSWAADPSIGNRMINARAETVAEKPFYRRAFKARQCLMPATGFFEWQTQGSRKQPYLLRLKDARPFAFAGLWERWQGDGSGFESCCLITTATNALMAAIHDRMPVLLHPEDYAAWLDPKIQDPVMLMDLLRPYPAELMDAFPVSRLVNNPQQDRPECITPLD